MKKTASYGQFCPVARAAEIVASRWTPVLLRELMAGSIKFNDLRSGLPHMSPSLLSKRLKELEAADIIKIEKAKSGRGSEYFITESGMELAPVIMTLGSWGQKFIMKEFAKYELDPTLLMWDIQRRIDTDLFPESGRLVINFFLVGAPKERRNWWLIVNNRNVELCVHPPGFEEDVSIEACLRGLTEVWMGQRSIDDAKKKNLLIFKGNKKYISSFKKWFLLSPFAEDYPKKK